VGLKQAQGIYLTEAFYWDMNDETRAFAKRFFDKNGRMPTMVQAGVYSSVIHYLKAVEALKSDADGAKELLNEIVSKGDVDQVRKAKALLATLN